MRVEWRLHAKGGKVRIKIVSFGTTKDAGLKLRKYQLLIKNSLPQCWSEIWTTNKSSAQ